MLNFLSVVWQIWGFRKGESWDVQGLDYLNSVNT